MNFDKIVLGGGVIEALGDFMLPIIKQNFQDHVFDAAAKALKLLPQSLGMMQQFMAAWL